MAKIMNVGLISLSIILIAFSFAVADEVHPGLKDAIDKGDYKTAKNLKEKMYVQSVYLPAKLSVEDAEYIYGPLKGYRWILSLDSRGCSHDEKHECSPEFLDKYIAKICSGTTEFDVNACLDWMNSSPIAALNRFSDLFCANKESVKRCSLYVDRLPIEKQYQYLKELDLKGLVEYTKAVEIDSLVEEKVPKKECLEKWKKTYAVIKSSIESDSRYNQSRSYLYESIVCFFDGTKTKMKKCIGFLDKLSNEMQNDCKTGKLTKEVRKKIKVKRLYKPYDKILRKIKYSLDKTPWYAMDELWLEKAKFIQKYLNEEPETAQLLVDHYSTDGKLTISEVKRACLMYPAIDKFISKKYGVDVISCSQILNDYPTFLGANCELNDSTKKILLPVELKSRKSDTTFLVCDDKAQKYRYLSQIEILEDIVQGIYGDCSGEGEQKLIFTCKNGKWKSINEINTDGVDFEKKVIVKGKLDSNLFFFKDFRDNRIYRAVKIGNQTWMAENLTYGDSLQYGSLSGRSWCYDDKNLNCRLYGRYYTWSAVMDSLGSISSNGKNCGYQGQCRPTYPLQGICPEGWHLPDTTEWNALFAVVGGKASAGEALKSISDWKSSSQKETNIYGFSALPAGFSRNGGRQYGDKGYGAYFWSSTGYNSFSAYTIGLRDNRDSVSLGTFYMESGFSVRCVKD